VNKIIKRKRGRGFNTLALLIKWDFTEAMCVSSMMLFGRSKVTNFCSMDIFEQVIYALVFIFFYFRVINLFLSMTELMKDPIFYCDS